MEVKWITHQRKQKLLLQNKIKVRWSFYYTNTDVHYVTLHYIRKIFIVA